MDDKDTIRSYNTQGRIRENGEGGEKFGARSAPQIFFPPLENIFPPPEIVFLPQVPIFLNSPSFHMFNLKYIMKDHVSQTIFT